MVGLNQDIKLFLIADLHLGHKNVLTLCRRKFNSIQEHDEHVIRSINEKVLRKDHLYILGDLGFHCDINSLREALLSINTRNIHIVKGNHDHLHDLVQLKREGVICDVKEMQEIQKVGHSDRIFLCHYPMREWPGFYRGALHAHGHTHNTLEPYERSLDVGVDSIGYYPIEFDEFVERVKIGYKSSRITDTDRMINEFFPNLSTVYFTALCTGNEEIRAKITEVLTREGKMPEDV